MKAEQYSLSAKLTITGGSGGKCVLEVEVSDVPPVVPNAEVLKGKKMTCTLAPSQISLGYLKSGANAASFASCSGSLVSSLSAVLVEKVPATTETEEEPETKEPVPPEANKTEEQPAPEPEPANATIPEEQGPAPVPPEANATEPTTETTTSSGLVGAVGEYTINENDSINVGNYSILLTYVRTETENNPDKYGSFEVTRTGTIESEGNTVWFNSSYAFFSGRLGIKLLSVAPHSARIRVVSDAMIPGDSAVFGDYSVKLTSVWYNPVFPYLDASFNVTKLSTSESENATIQEYYSKGFFSGAVNVDVLGIIIWSYVGGYDAGVAIKIH